MKELNQRLRTWKDAARETAHEYARKYARPAAIVVVFMALGWLTGLHFLAGVVAMAYFNGPDLVKRNKAAREASDLLRHIEQTMHAEGDAVTYRSEIGEIYDVQMKLREAFRW